jgi:hypothetical protein
MSKSRHLLWRSNQTSSEEKLSHPQITLLTQPFLMSIDMRSAQWLSRCQARHVSRFSRRNVRLVNAWYRSYHSAIAKFTTIDANGQAIGSETGIMVGGPKEGYIYVEPEVGNAIKSAIIRQLGWDAADIKTLPLQFHHDSLHFAHSAYYIEFNGFTTSPLTRDRIDTSASY